MFYPVFSHDMRYFLRLWRPWRQFAAPNIESSVTFGRQKFQADLDVQYFKPEDITIKVAEDNTVTVEGKQEHQEGENYVSRHFVRRFVLPEGHDMDKLESTLSTDGVLTITAPRIAKEAEEGRTIPITRTGKAHKSGEN
ncbi:heat shock protein 27 [Tribolium castaneum]|uniref:Heat shock protein 23-like Protein n=1 Tax=Tribolium castaneum TaxID=7070 RepID=D6WXQ8_TRICA|nr:PREDICTED: heat shock protein 27 [Tribolium castaneum]EFA07947.1 Heat shock protein 23-like Protein [Tribolium castaneum]|eukprot:XP_973378.1 PREDICTED: heat shock protein 27 [Tribolium castaneum]